MVQAKVGRTIRFWACGNVSSFYVRFSGHVTDSALVTGRLGP